MSCRHRFTARLEADRDDGSEPFCVACERVTYGAPERDERLPYISGFYGDGRPIVSFALRRKVFTTWRDEQGGTWGSWCWEYL